MSRPGHAVHTRAGRGCRRRCGGPLRRLLSDGRVGGARSFRSATARTWRTTRRPATTSARSS
eukprot:scaffold6249_cov395-Prasinococcus_capsulatus_cf.AAC.2